jgi:hypothetical protein
VLVGHTAQGEAASIEPPFYALEGRFVSVADRSYVLGLPESHREAVLAERAANVLRRQQDLARTSTIAATQRRLENNKKRRIDSDVEDRVSQPGDAQEFTIHRDLICANSKFFNAACSKLWTEGKEKVVRLPEVKVDTFQAYFVWAYTGRVVINKGAPRDELKATIDLYLLGDVLDDLLLRNAAMESLVANIPVWNVVPPVNLVSHVWDVTLPGSRLRQVIVDVVIMRVSRANLETFVTVDHPIEFLHSIAIASTRQVATVSVDKFLSGMSGYLEPELGDTMAKSK